MALELNKKCEKNNKFNKFSKNYVLSCYVKADIMDIRQNMKWRLRGKIRRKDIK